MNRFAFVFLCLTACPSDDPALPIDAGPVGTTNQLDVLFVIDDSGSMGSAQQALAARMPQLLGEVVNAAPSDLSLHVGVISSNVGAGGHDIIGSTCTADGDAGRLQMPLGCRVSGKFLIEDHAATGKVTNYDEGLGREAAVQCMVELGSGGCGFEQHLEALARATDGSLVENDDFLRPDAGLLVIVLADEDDCSASDGALFDPRDSGFDSVLGPLESYRCTEFGVVCAEGSLPRAAGSFSECKANPDETYLRHPSSYAAKLTAAKADPRRVAVMTIVGPSSPVATAKVEGPVGEVIRLQPSCAAPATVDISAHPAVRLVEFGEQFDSHAALSICELSGANLAEAGVLARAVMGN